MRSVIQLKRLSAAILVMVLLLVSASIFAEETAAPKKYTLYYVADADIRLGEASFVPERDSTDSILQNLIDTYNTGHRDAVVRLLPGNITIDTWSMENGTLILNLSENYRELETNQEMLVRAAFVKTFTQFPEVLFVECRVDGENVRDASGKPVGPMSSDTFVEINSTDKDAYRYDSFILYFANQDGTELVPETRRVYYRRSLSKARVAIEQLANGPMEKGNYPTISPNVTLLGVVSSDGICYVDFDDVFTGEPVSGIPPEIAVNSVVHTLLANTDAEKIEILVNGQSDKKFGEMDLYRFFGWNGDLVSRRMEDTE